MIFLQPWIWIGLPIVLLPIAIHLLNQRRHRPIHWGAMHFLRQASRMHQGAARIRYWLILLFRLIAVACVLLFLSRPLATGWLSVVGSSPSKVIIILDRSPSMEATEKHLGVSKRAAAIAKLDAMFESLGNRSERILFVSPDKPPLIVPPDRKLSELEEVQPTAVSTPMPALVAQVIRYIRNEGLGPTEVWCCSDLQANDWDASSGLWATNRDSLAECPYVRWTNIAYHDHEHFNLAVRVQRSVLQQSEQSAHLLMDFYVKQTGGDLLPRTIPVTIHVGQARTVVEVELSGRETIRTGLVVPIDSEMESGAGTIELPGDANLADNAFCFAFAQPPTLRTLIVAEEESGLDVLRLMASTPANRQQESECEVLPYETLSSLNLDEVGLLIWQAPLPVDEIAKQIIDFASRGRAVIFFPPKGPSMSKNAPLFGLRWDGWSEVDEENVTLSRWREDSDLLRNSESGESLSVADLQISRFCKLDAHRAVQLASFSNEVPFLCRAATESGSVYFCSTLPTPECSSLTDNGVVLYAMIQRALAEGSNSISGVQRMDAGSATPTDLEHWERIDGGEETIVATDRSNHAAVYRNDNRLLVINRAVGEDDRTKVDEPTMKVVFDGSNTRLINDTIEREAGFTREIWRWFAIAVVLALLAEAFLSLPNMSVARTVSFGRTTR